MMKGTKKPNVYVGALVCTTGAWVLFIGTVATVQTKKKKKKLNKPNAYCSCMVAFYIANRYGQTLSRLAFQQYYIRSFNYSLH